MKFYTILLVLLLPLALAGQAFTLVSESPGELLIDFELPEYQLNQVNAGGAVWHKLQCDGGSVFSLEGQPELLSFSTAIAVPFDGDVTVQVLSDNNQSFSEIDMVPSARMQVSQDEVNYEFFRDNRAYAKSSIYPELVYEIGEAACVGDRRFVPLRVFPFRYRSVSRELQVSNQISLRVLVTGTKASYTDWLSSQNPIDQVGADFFLNNASSVSWRVPKKKDNSYESPKGAPGEINEIQLVVDQAGIYKVSYQYLKDYIEMMVDSLGVEMAWDIDNVDPRHLELSYENGQVPIAFYGETDASFDQGDYFEFYGDRHYGDEGYQDDYTAENIYTLSWVNRLGARLMVENGGLVNSNPSQYIVPDGYEHTIHLEEQLVSDKLGNKWTAADAEYYREDVWFWKKISAPNLDIIPFDLQYPLSSNIRSASAKIMLHGLTYAQSLLPGQYDHEASVRINQAMVNTHTWTGQNEKLFQNANPISNTFFNHGTNYLYISLSGNGEMGDREQILLDWAELTYWREYKTSEDFIEFSKPSNRPNGLYQFELQGFSEESVSVYKIGSSVFNNLQIEPFNIDGIAPWTVTFQDSVFSTSVKYYAVTESQKKTPKDIRLNFYSDLRNPSNRADVIVVSPRMFMEAEGTIALVDLWESEGFTVELVDIQDIYDEFNSGIVSAESIKEFAQYAYNNWSAPQLQHLILLGEGSEDARDNSPSRKYNVIPVKKTWTYKHGATASDNWFGCIVGDDIIADISVARINAWEAEQILDYATKAIRYHTQPTPNRLWNSHVTFTAGGKITDEDDIFSQQSERILRQKIPPHYRATRVYTSTQTVSSDYFGGTFNLKDAINSGTNYVQFMGHGGGRIWADYNLFNFNDVATLNNQVYPIVVSLACYASAFDTNGMASISEALTLQPGKGAIATIGFSGLGYLDQDEDYGLALTEALFTHDFDTVGQALMFAKARFFTTTSSTAPRYALTNATAYLGDPLIYLRKPLAGIDVTANDYSLSVGDTLRVSASFPDDVTAARLYLMQNSGKVVNVPFDLPVIQGSYTATYVIPANQGDNYQRKINVTGYSGDTEYVGLSAFGVGRPAVFHQELRPAAPSWRDSTSYTARVFSPEDIISLVVRVRTDSTSLGATWVERTMTQDSQDENLYHSVGYVPGQRTGREIIYKYKLTTSAGVSESPIYRFVTAGPDILLSDIELVEENEQMKLRVLVENIGNAASIDTDLRLYYIPVFGSTVLHSEQICGPVAPGELRWEYVDLDGIPSANLRLEVRVNSSGTFPEWHLFFNTNNVISLELPFNYHQVTSSGAILNSVDSNLSVEIPANLVNSGSSIFYVKDHSPLTANNQPDIHNIAMFRPSPDSSATHSIAYEIRTLDSSLVDSLGVFTGGKQIKLSFHYSATDSLAQFYEGQNNYNIYRWDATYSKWMRQGGNTSTIDNKVVFDVDRQGIYTIFRNSDRTGPSIDVNVQDQEFTVGGYVSGTGTISLLLSDANGINVIDSSIRLILNGNPVPQEDYALSISSENINRVPIKYQLNLPRGNYTLLVDCSDVNANANSRVIQFFVNDEFNIVNIGNYPNPVLGRALDPKNDGRTRFTYVLTDDADEVTIKVYTISGRLVKTFSNLPGGVGYHEFPRTVYAWDCRDEQGYLLANGTYFYKIIARKGSKTIEKTMKMAILK